MELQFCTAIVTGGSKGYGAGIAEALKKAGADVWITGRNESNLHETAQALQVREMVADVTSGADWDRLFERVCRESGRVDILVNNAGAGVCIAPMDQQTDESIMQSVAVNLTGVLFGCRRASQLMREQGAGQIINISSGCAIHAWPGWSVYSAAKAGLNQFGHCLYTELREAGVRVTTVTPYWGATDFVIAAEIEGHPAGDPQIRRHCIQPREMGDVVVNICQMPDHLAVPDITVQPLCQEIVPM